jgi:hypothetical protein
MKHGTVFLFIIFFSFYTAAQEKESSQFQDPAIKKDLLLSYMQLNSSPGYNMRDKLLLLNSEEEKEKSEQQRLEQAASQAENFKLSTGLLYFAGAAAVAAIIYFLVPDNKPSAEKTYTFGLPVTPK